MIEERIINYISIISKKKDIDPSTDLFSDLQSSSIVFFEIIEKIESSFGISFNYEDFDLFFRKKSKYSIKIHQLVEIVKMKLEQKKC